MRLALHHPVPTRHDDRSPRPTTTLVPAVIEAVAYLGGLLALIGLTLLVSAYWDGMPSTLRIVLPATATALALTSAALVAPATAGWPVGEAAVERMRSFLWLVAIAAGAVTGGVAATELVERHPARTVAALGATAALAVATALWRGRQRPVPQAAAMTAGLVAVATGMAETSTGSAGLIVVALAICLLALGLGRLTPSPWITVGIAAVGLLVGSAMTADTWHGEGLLMIDATVATLFVIALGPIDRGVAERRCVLAVALLGTWIGVPQSVAWFSGEAPTVTGAVIWATGLCVAALALRALTRHARIVTVAGALMMVGGAALTGRHSVALAVVWGTATAMAMLVIGTRRFALSVVGALGLLVDVPWAILHFLPGERRAPLAILAAGIVLVGVAVVLVRRLARRDAVSEPPDGPPTT